MKNRLGMPAAALSLAAAFASAHGSEQFDLRLLAQSGGLEVFNREVSLLDESTNPGIRLSKRAGEGVAWLEGVEFSQGTIEFDVRGENLKQQSFVGVAFHGQDDATFDAVYFRPFQFREADKTLRARSIQYVSLPEFTWRRLREQSPGRYEGAIEPVPDPDGWFHVRVVVEGAVVSAYVNGNTVPSLVVEKLTDSRTGAVGLYVADTSGGDFSNLVVTTAVATQPASR